jgi:3',5'-cyclic AMP phosphodiesterase CpdA
MSPARSFWRPVLLVLVVSLFLGLFPGGVKADPERFAVVTDSHVGGIPESGYAEAIRAIGNEQPDLLIHVGDAIDKPGNLSQWRSFFEITGNNLKFFLAPGNHDIRGQNSFTVYRRFFDYSYRAVADGDTLLLILNTEIPGQESRITGEQLAWLAAQLARPFRYKLVFLHEPLYGAVPLHGLDRHIEERDRLHRLFVASGVSLVVQGHDHVYDRRSRDGITYVIAGRTGGRLFWPSAKGGSFCFMVCGRAEGGYSCVTKDLEGHVMDGFHVGGGAARTGKVQRKGQVIQP